MLEKTFQGYSTENISTLEIYYIAPLTISLSLQRANLDYILIDRKKCLKCVFPTDALLGPG